MVLVIDQLNALPRLLILHILILQHVLHCLEFLTHTQLATLDQMRVQYRDSSKIHKRTDIADLKRISSGKRRVDREITHIADRKYRHCDQKSREIFSQADIHLRILRQVHMDQPEQN